MKGKELGSEVSYELSLIAELNELDWRVRWLSDEVSHGNDKQALILSEKLLRQSELVTEVLRKREEFPRINVSSDETGVELSWDPIRQDIDFKQRKKYKISDLEKIDPMIKELLKKTVGSVENNS